MGFGFGGFLSEIAGKLQRTFVGHEKLVETSGNGIWGSAIMSGWGPFSRFWASQAKCGLSQKCWVEGVPLRNRRWATNDFCSPQKVVGNMWQQNLGFGNNERVAAIFAFLG